MSVSFRIFELLRFVGDPCVDRSMVFAIPTADATSRRLIALTLLERRDPEGLAGLVEFFHLLDSDLQGRLLDLNELLDRPLRMVCAKQVGPGPANVLEVIRQARAHRLGYLVIEQLRHGSETTRREAGQAVLDLARSAILAEEQDPTGHQAPTHDARPIAQLITAVEEGVALYRHHQQDTVLRALATLCPRPMQRALHLLNELRNPALEPVRNMLESATDAPAVRACVAWLRVSTLTESCIVGLRRSVVNDNVVHALPMSHLLRSPRSVETLAGLRDPHTLVPNVERLERLTPTQSRGLPGYIAALPLPAPRQRELLMRTLRHRDAMTRLSTLRCLYDGLTPKAIADHAEAISHFTLDADERIARLAYRVLLRIRWSGLAQISLKLVNSPHASLRALAGRYMSQMGFDRLWEAWPRLGAPQRLAAGRALIKLDPNFHSQLARQLAHADPERKLRAISMIHQLNQGNLFEKALVRLAQHTDHVVASAAVGALGSGESPEALDTLEDSLDHKDARVRANAVEALQQLQSTRHIDRLLHMADHEENRPRANAIAALMDMRTTDALGALSRMLSDHRSPHRNSALWLVEQAGLIEMARHVAELSVSDPDPKIKNRARETVQSLITLMSPPPEVSPAPAPGSSDQSPAEDSPADQSVPAVTHTPSPTQ